MESQDRISIYRQVIDVINRNDAAALDQFLAEELMDHNPIPGQSPGRTGFKEWMASARTSFPDLHGTIDEVIGFRFQVQAERGISDRRGAAFRGVRNIVSTFKVDCK